MSTAFGGPPQFAITHAPADDGQLVRRAQHGEIDALATLIRAHESEIRTVTRRFARDADEIEDMTQEIWLRVAEKIAQVSEPDRFRAWIRTLSRNVCLNLLRRHGGDAHLDASPQAAARATSEAATPEEHLLSCDDQRMVWEAIGTLKVEDRRVLRLRELQHLGYAEIASELCTSAHAAEVRSSRARDRLRRQLKLMADSSSPCPVNPLGLRAIAESDGARRERTPLDDHVTSCPSCQRRLAVMRIGKRVFSGLSAVAVLPHHFITAFATLRHLPLATPAMEETGLSAATFSGVALATAIASAVVGIDVPTTATFGTPAATVSVEADPAVGDSPLSDSGASFKLALMAAAPDADAMSAAAPAAPAPATETEAPAAPSAALPSVAATVPGRATAPTAAATAPAPTPTARPSAPANARASASLAPGVHANEASSPHVDALRAPERDARALSMPSTQSTHTKSPAPQRRMAGRPSDPPSRGNAALP